MCSIWNKLNVFHGERLWQGKLLLAEQIRLLTELKDSLGLYPEVHSLDLDVETGEIVGNAYLFLKEQLELSAMPLPSGITHGTIIMALMNRLG
ncbi:hypothetical protein POTOM_030710 [Populus tomentosa]|uniref:Uncharacterized protein n=1 Tax=Populus tomentosa TaxID=118781 RepID=A0A8X8CHX3_POPTO|nr:hypothetical protein POTOM_030710 [Populus tomentosa]